MRERAACVEAARATLRGMNSAPVAKPLISGGDASKKTRDNERDLCAIASETE